MDSKAAHVDDVIVIGAGMVGLVTALRLAKAGRNVTVLEREAVPGGLAASFAPAQGSDRLEKFYHHIFRTDRAMVALLAELGLERELIWSQPETACLHDDGIRRLDSAAALLRFDRIAFFDRIRLTLALAFLKLLPDSQPIERYEAASWLRHWAGRRAYAEVFEPLFTSKFGRHAETISLAWFWARIHDRTATLGYVRGGFARLYDELVDRIRAAGGHVRFGHTVVSIEREDSDFSVVARIEGRDVVARATIVVATIPEPLLARLFGAYRPARREDPPKAAIAARCLILALDRSLTGTYWLNMCQHDAPFMVLVEHTALVPPERYGGKHLIYCGEYGDDLSAETTDQLIVRFASTFRRLNPRFDSSWIRDAWSFAAPFAQPIVTPDYRATIPTIETSIPGLFLASLYQVFPHDRGQNYAIVLAEEVVGRCLRVFKRGSASSYV